MRITAATNFQNVAPTDLARFVQIFCDNVSKVVNGKLTFSENVDCAIVKATFGSANANVTLNHTLNRAPIGYIPISLSAAMTIFSGSVSASSTTLTLQSNLAGSATLLIF